MPKTAIITGATGALAAPTIDTFQQAGYRLALLGRDPEACRALQTRYPQQLVKQLDLLDEGATQAAVREVEDKLSGVGAVLNIAGGFAMHPATETTTDELDKQLDINFRTAFNITRAILPGMVAQGEGFILGVAASAAADGGAKLGPYASAKGALVAYLKSVHAELAPKGVRVSVLYPMGVIDTPDNRKAMPKSDPGSWLEPMQLAESMLHLASRSKRGHITELKVYPPA